MADLVLLHNHKIKKAHNLKLDSPNSTTATLDRRITNTNQMKVTQLLAKAKSEYIYSHADTVRHTFIYMRNCMHKLFKRVNDNFQT